MDAGVDEERCAVIHVQQQCSHGVIDALCVRCTLEGVQMPMLQHPGEIVPFFEWALSEGLRKVLEIGTGPGGLTEAFCLLTSEIVISIDLSTDLGKVRNIYLHTQHQNFAGVAGDSHDVGTILQVDALLAGDLVDLLFIDGDHSAIGVSQDAATYRAFVKPGGWIAFHDINSDKFNGPEMGVPEFWKSLKGEKREWSVGYEWGGIGAVRV